MTKYIYVALDSNGQRPFRSVSNGQRWTFETSDRLFRPVPNGRRPPETGGDWTLLQRIQRRRN